jgi:uncharacterized protein with NRDE domain
LEPGIFGLSNDLLDHNWPKVNLGEKRLADLISQENSISTDALNDLMSDCEIAADAHFLNSVLNRAQQS